MPVDTPHPDYTRWATHWRKMRDVVLGQEAMDRATIGSRIGSGDPVTQAGAGVMVTSLGRDYYLPPLGGQTATEYAAYVKRASFYGATARTVDALCGAIFRRSPVVQASDELTQQLEDVDLAGTPVETFAKLAVAEVLTVGRYGILVDAPPDGGRPYWTGYGAEDILSWSSARIDGAMRLTRVVLRERGWMPCPTDEFGYEATEQYRVLDLDESGGYRVRLYQAAKDAWTLVSEAAPTRFRERLTVIPFVFYGPTTVHACPERPPLLDMADVNLAHYRKAADYAHGLHFTALPTPWIADRDIPPTATFKIGSEAAWTMSESGSCGMLEFSGAGMAAIKDAMQDDETRMAHLGAELLMPDKRAAEAADTLRIRSGAKTASLASVANTGSWALSKAAEFHAWWLGESEEQIEETSITLNTEFAESHLDPQELTAWVAARQAGEVTRRMFIDLMARREALGDATVDEVLVELEAESEATAEREALKAEAAHLRDVTAVLAAQGRADEDEEGGVAA